MMQKIQVTLYGKLARFGGPYDFLAQSAADCVSALCAQLPEFEGIFRQGRYRLLAGKAKEARLLAGPDCFARLGADQLHILPQPDGAGRGDGQLILGLTLLGLSFVPGVTGGLASALGSSSAAGAASQIGARLLGSSGAVLVMQGMAGNRSARAHSPAGEAASGLLAAPASSSEGHAIPLIYGQVRLAAPQIIASSLQVETQKI